MILGFFFVRRIPLPTYDLLNTTEYGAVPDDILEEEETESVLASGAETPLLGGDPIAVRTGTSLELNSSRPALTDLGRRSHSTIHRSSFSDAPRIHIEPVDISGKQLLVSTEFWIMVVIMSLCMSFLPFRFMDIYSLDFVQ